MTLSEKVIMWSAVAQSFGGIVLVIVTIYYAIQAKKTVATMEKSGKNEFLPIVMIGVVAPSSNEKVLRINLTNNGKGIAKRPLKLTFPGIPSRNLNSLNVGQSSAATIDYNTDYVLEQEESKRKMCLEYEDVFGRKIKTETDLVETTKLGTEGKTRGITIQSWNLIIE